jgi:hypothetical protein
MAKTRKSRVPKVPKLTKLELRLAEYPPNEGTWQCQNVYETVKSVNGVDEVIKITCGMANTKKRKECTFCRSPRPKKPVQLYPVYVATMKKLGLPLGTKFMVSYMNGTPKGSWKFKRNNTWVEWTTDVFSANLKEGTDEESN